MKRKIKRLLRDNNFRLGLAVILAAALVWMSLDQEVSSTFRDIWGSQDSQNVSGGTVPGKVYISGQSGSHSSEEKTGTTDQLSGTSDQQPGTSEEGTAPSGEQNGNAAQDSAQAQDSAGSTDNLPVNQEEQKFNDLLVAGSRGTSPEKFFAQYRLERDQARGRQVEWVQTVVNNAKTSEETRREAQKKLLSLSDYISWETQVENMLRAKNYQDALVFVKDNSVTVIVQAGELAKQDVDRITDLVSRVTGRNAEQMVIIPKN
ncbi:MAG TPA: SpoIIIAH-like family protein [Bacillota bacterium]|nr:SpoIIIAH-like family protein [Bacillota bacterium]